MFKDAFEALSRTHLLTPVIATQYYLYYYEPKKNWVILQLESPSINHDTFIYLVFPEIHYAE
jgi:hypothetical protein